MNSKDIFEVWLAYNEFGKTLSRKVTMTNLLAQDTYKGLAVKQPVKIKIDMSRGIMTDGAPLEAEQEGELVHLDMADEEVKAIVWMEQYKQFLILRHGEDNEFGTAVVFRGTKMTMDIMEARRLITERRDVV